ncbi:MAG TPA: hypothetical protein VF463_19660 [Sphingobium sp.]
MHRLSKDDLARYCSRLKDFNMSAAACEGAVRSLHLIFSSVIDAALGKSSTDLAIDERNLRDAFQTAAGHDRLSPRNTSVANDAAISKPKIDKEKRHDI